MRHLKTAGWIVLMALVFTSLGIWLGSSSSQPAQALRDTGHKIRSEMVESVARASNMDVRMMLIMEHPELLDALQEGGGFGGEFDIGIAQDMFTREGPGVEAARKLTKVVKTGPRTWLIRLPIVNAVLFETDEGLVLVDTGMGVGGPSVVDAIRSVSSMPLHTIIYTHGHVDHAYGAWALLEEAEAAGRTVQVIAHEALPKRFERYLELRGSLARYMNQPLSSLPQGREDLVWPTRTFSEQLEIEVGGERFVLRHLEGETDDHLYVWVPGRRAIASGDFYQGFLPNAGNGKRVQRNVEEWIQALREMADLEPVMLLPGHGKAQTDPALIGDNLRVLADALEHIRNHTLDGLNRGLRKDQIFQSAKLPPQLAMHPTLSELYVSAKDVSKMVLKRYTGWWDDIPSNWSPAPMEEQGRTIVELVGGMEALDRHARRLMETDLAMASHLTDWAFLADPDHPVAQQLAVDVYRRRIVDPTTNTQERIAYLDVIVEARRRQMERGGGGGSAAR